VNRGKRSLELPANLPSRRRTAIFADAHQAGENALDLEDE